MVKKAPSVLYFTVPAVAFHTEASVEVCVVKLKVAAVPRAGSLGQVVLFIGLHDVQVCAAAGERSESKPRKAKVDAESMMAEISTYGGQRAT